MCLTKVIFKYDAHDNMIESLVYKGKDTLDYKTDWKYDAKGDPLESTFYTNSISGLTLDSKFTYLHEKYDAAGNWLKQTSYRNGKPEMMIGREIEYY